MGEFLLDLLTKVVNFFRTILSDGFGFIIDAIKSFFTWIGDLLYDLIGWLADVITSLFGDLFELLDGLLYFGAESFSVIVLVLQVILKIISFPFVFIGNLIGLFTSFLSWNGSAIQYNNEYSQGYSIVFGFLSDAGFGVVAAVFMVLIWIAFVFAILRVARG